MAIIIFMNCSSSKGVHGKITLCKECYTIERLKMQNENSLKSTLLFNYFDYRSKIALPFDFVIIDDFAFKENPVEIIPVDGTIDIVISKHARQLVKIENVNINKGDSLVVNVYLKEFNPIMD